MALAQKLASVSSMRNSSKHIIPSLAMAFYFWSSRCVPWCLSNPIFVDRTLPCHLPIPVLRTPPDLLLFFREKVEVIHNASVMGAVASCGLQLYNFGQTVSIPLWNENWEPDSFHEKIRVNKEVIFL